jgi:methyl-accepting chemotaxis protein
MDRNLQAWFMVLVVATTVSVAMQLGILVAVVYGLRRLHAKIKDIEAILRSHASMIGEVATDVRETVRSIKSVTNNVVELSGRIKSTVDETAEVYGRQLRRVDRVIGNVAAGVDRVSDYVENGVIRPLREIQAVSAALRSALSVFFRSGRNTETQ